jgi:hypothetical protein
MASKMRNVSFPSQYFTAACHSLSDWMYLRIGSDVLEWPSPLRGAEATERCDDSGSKYATRKYLDTGTPSCLINLSYTFWRMSSNETLMGERKDIMVSSVRKTLMARVSSVKPPVGGVRSGWVWPEGLSRDRSDGCSSFVIYWEACSGR